MLRILVVLLLAGSTLDTRVAFAQERVIQVGPERNIRTVAEAARVAQSGDVVEIDAGTYVGDVAVWLQRRITIRGLGEGARLEADGRSAEGKAIWVFRNADARVENVIFRGTRVPSRNGAGIRFEQGRLQVEGCVFEDNENGILIGNERNTEVDIRFSVFSRNGHGDGYSHNLYAGTIASLTVTGSYFRAARVGHLLKSRAARNYIAYNRLTDEDDGTASYEIDLPNGGLATVFGNLLQQGPRTENPAIVSFGAEGYRYPENRLDLAYNTLVDGRPSGGIFVAVRPGATDVRAFNNVLIGPGRPGIPVGTDGNVRIGIGDVADARMFDYRIRPTAGLLGNVVTAPPDRAPPLPPAQYAHPAALIPLEPGALRPLPGAFQVPAD
jgi:hypothetical protein